MQNYPNPFNPSTTITYKLANPGSTRITIYNLLGQEVKSFEMGAQYAGTFAVRWNGRDERERKVSSGVYIYRLKSESVNGTGTVAQVRKMLLLK